MLLCPRGFGALGACAIERARVVTVTLASTVVITATASPARAYCRESLDTQSQGACEPDPGVPYLFWKRSCMTYRFNEHFFEHVPLLSEAAARRAFDDAFETWAAVDCGRKPFYAQQASGTTATDSAEFVYDLVNESVVVARDKKEWAALPDHSDRALALTSLWHDKVTGEILDVDMEINTGAGSFADCERQPCGPNMIDLQNTVTHEAGHLLGLGHSAVTGSTMEAATHSRPETGKRTLEADDRKGYCALDLPEWDCSGANCTCPPPDPVPSRRTIRTCGCDVPGGRARTPGWPLLSLLGAYLARARRRRKPRTVASP